MNDLDGLEVRVQCACCICKNRMTLMWAGVTETVTELMSTQPGNVLSTVVQSKLEDNTFELWILMVVENSIATSFQKMFKYPTQQYLDRVQSDSATESTTVHREDIADLLSNQRSPERLKVQHTRDGADL